MSSRALRKLQRQQAQTKKLADATPSEDEEDQPEDLAKPIPSQSKTNAFDLLGAAEEDNTSASESLTAALEERPAQPTSTKQIKKAKKKKKKAKTRVEVDLEEHDNPESGQSEDDLSSWRGAGDDADNSSNPDSREGEDEVANSEFKSSNHRKKKKNKVKNRRGMKPSQSASALVKNRSSPLDADVDVLHVPAGEPSTRMPNQLFAIDSKDLNPINEMKRLFGNVVLELERENRASPDTGRRRGRVQHLDLGGALAGQHFATTQGKTRTTAGALLRRNVLMPGKEEWPQAPSGGLGMEMIEDIGDGIMYEFVHNAAYQDIQRQFYMCVDSMDPQRMIVLLQHNPYHVATLLQVSEIAKQQGDHSVSADLLERALFTFGRSIHSTFGASLREGKAKLDFLVQENRDFWLTVWRYISNLGQRGTWRTAYEWAKLLFNLDPSTDPYAITLVIDQLALRARNHGHFIQLCEEPGLIRDSYLSTSPNLQSSLSLAYFRAGNMEKCQLQLRKCFHNYPWMFARMFKDLNIEPVPKSIWGQQPESEFEHLICELYVSRAKDLWNTPETIALLKKAAEDEPIRKDTGPSTRSLIQESEARHVLLLEDPSLIVLLPSTFRGRYGSPNDPLPPVNPFAADDSELDSDDESLPSTRPGDPMITLEEDADGRFIATGADRSFFNRIMNLMRGDGHNDNAGSRIAEERFEQMLHSAQQGDIEGTEFRDEPPSTRHATVEEDVWESDPEGPFRDAIPDDDGPVLETPEEADQRSQRFLAGRGLQALRDFVAANGADEANWVGGLDESPLSDYASKLLSLRARATRQFILKYILPQGTSLTVKDLVVRRLERLQPGSTR